MSVRKTRSAPRPKKSRRGRPTLKDLASHLDLSPATISLVLNRSPVADAIPEETQQRVFAAARELGYRPNYIAVSLRSRRTNSIGVLVPEVSDPWAAEIVSGIESHLLANDYHYLVTSHRRSTPKLLRRRSGAPHAAGRRRNDPAGDRAPRSSSAAGRGDLRPYAS